MTSFRLALSATETSQITLAANCFWRRTNTLNLITNKVFSLFVLNSAKCYRNLQNNTKNLLRKKEAQKQTLGHCDTLQTS